MAAGNCGSADTGSGAEFAAASLSGTAAATAPATTTPLGAPLGEAAGGAASDWSNQPSLAMAAWNLAAKMASSALAALKTAALGRG